MRSLKFFLLFISILSACSPRFLKLLKCPPSTMSDSGFTLDWAMPDRFGRDLDNDGILDVPNTLDYVQNVTEGGAGVSVALFTVSLIPVLTSWNAEDVTEYKWSICHPSWDAPAERIERSPSFELAEDDYQVTLTLTDRFGRRASTTKTIFVEDILIVALGDSYSSGEGNPDQPIVKDRHPAFWLDGFGGVPSAYGSIAEQINASQNHARSHRSGLAWAAQAALKIERADPRSSVTFVFLAASGATISKGVIGRYEGVDNEVSVPLADPAMPSQISETKRLVKNRSIDALTISIGGNDMGFANILVALMLHSHTACHFMPDCLTYGDIENAMKTGKWEDLHIPVLMSGGMSVMSFFTGGSGSIELGNTPGLNKLYDEFDKMAQKFSQLNVKNVYFIEYPDPSLNGSVCSEILDDITGSAKIDLDEANWARVHVLNPMNDAVKKAAKDHHWIFMQSSASEFTFGEHGECGAAPYSASNYPDYITPWNEVGSSASGTRWFRTASESLVIQGDGSGHRGKSATKGTMHPNEFGHKLYADALLNTIRLPVDIPLIGKKDGDDQISEVMMPGINALQIPFDYSGNIDSRTDVDLKWISVSGGAEVRVQVTGSLGLVPKIKIFKSSGMVVKQTMTGSLTWEVSEGEGGYYYIGVSGSTNNTYNVITGRGDKNGTTMGNYTVTSLYVRDGVGNNMATATPTVFQLSSRWLHVSTPRQVKMFKLVKVNEKMSLRFLTQSGISMRIRIFNAAGGEIASGVDDLTYTFSTPSEYYVGLCAANAGTYQPSVGVTTASGNIGSAQLNIWWEDDPDDKVSEARLKADISPGGTLQAVLAPWNDLDLWVLTVPAAQNVSINITAGNELFFNEENPDHWTEPTVQPLLRLFDSRYIEIAKRTGAILTMPLAAGTYFIGITRQSNLDYYNPVNGHGGLSGKGNTPYVLTVGN
jgi:hypothetical protein